MLEKISEEKRELIRHKLTHNGMRTLSVIYWTVLAIVIGIIVGLIAATFGVALQWATKTRISNPNLIYLLPLGGLLIVFSYRAVLKEKDGGTNVVLSAIHSGDRLPVRMAPLIYISTLITHLLGGSAGREGAALQMGGSIGNGVGRVLKLNQQDRTTAIMCGMAAAFSGLFGTPMAAAVFSLEVISVGIMHYAALVPCVISALIARGIAGKFGLFAESYPVVDVPALGIKTSVIIVILAVICGLISMGFCIGLHKGSEIFSKYLKNPYVKVLVGGCSIVALTLLVGNRNYNGAGGQVIASFFEGEHADWYTFILKMIFTILTLSTGYKGGEIVPTLFIGASVGSAFGYITGFAPTLCTAVGMGSMFCAVTNCPLATLLMCFELFGSEGAPYYLLAIAFSYLVSGYYSLYHSQKIVYSKYKSNFINIHAK